MHLPLLLHHKPKTSKQQQKEIFYKALPIFILPKEILFYFIRGE